MRKCQCKCSSRKLERNKVFRLKSCSHLTASSSSLSLILLAIMSQNSGNSIWSNKNILVGKKYLLAGRKWEQNRVKVYCAPVQSRLCRTRWSSLGARPRWGSCPCSSWRTPAPGSRSSRPRQRRTSRRSVLKHEDLNFELEPPHEGWRVKVHGKRQFYTICGLMDKRLLAQWGTC